MAATDEDGEMELNSTLRDLRSKRRVFDPMGHVMGHDKRASLGFLVGFVVVLLIARPSEGQTRPIQPATESQIPGAGATPSANGAVQENSANQGAGADPSAVGNQPTGLVPQAPTDTAAQLLSALQTREAQLAADTERTPESKEAVSKLYQQAITELESSSTYRTTKSEWNQRAAAAPALLQAAQQAKGKNSAEEIKRLQEKELQELAQLTFQEGQARFQALESQLAAATAKRNEIAEEITNRERRRKELPALVSDVRTKLDQQSLSAGASEPSTDALVVEATQWAGEARKIMLQEQLQSLEAELRAYEAETLLLPMQLELAQDQERLLQQLVNSVSAELNERRKNRITQFTIAYRAEDPPDEPFFNRLGKWLEPTRAKTDNELESINWRELATRQQNLRSDLTRAQDELKLWKDRRAKMSTRVDSNVAADSAGFNSWVGLMLRKQRADLPDPNQLSASIRYYQNEMQLADSLLFDLEDATIELRSRQDQNSVNSGMEQTELLKTSDQIIVAMAADVNGYLNDLYQIADVKEQTRLLTYEYRDFIDKHVLWIRSSKQLTASDWKPTAEGFRWMVDFQNWRSFGSLLAQDAQRFPAGYILFALGFGVLIINQAKLRRKIGKWSTLAEKNRCTEFAPTLNGLFCTLLVSIPLPLAMMFVYWRGSVAINQAILQPEFAEFTTALVTGVLLAIAILLPMEFLRQICRPDGLGAKHFDWQPKNARLLRSNLRWLIDLGIPLALIAGMFGSQSNTRWEASIGRIAFILLMPLLSVFFGKIFFPKSGIFSTFLEEHQGGWLDRLRFLWYPAVVLGPLVLAVVSFMGYHYTAGRIARHMDSTLWMVVILTVVYSLLKRWLLVGRRSLMIAKARQRLEEAAKRDLEAPPPTVEAEEEIDLVSINDQTKRLVTSTVVATGLVSVYFIWSDVLPALSLLDSFPLWTVQGALPDETVTISLANLVLVVPIVMLVVIAARNVPGLLEIALLQHLPLSTAARYAVTTLARYAIVALGIVIAGSTIGLRWNSIQWLVAALGVGLGFGLQEIFANFVSGIILLFEQPIRVGDIITIDGTTGTVSRIRMRATTIVNWDRQELVIPNKDLITGKLLNWTLTDSTNRIVLNVGVAYGTDTEKACELIREVCNEHENIMREPSPIVTFEGFGDNTLNLVVRAYLASLDNRLGTVHELHENIYKTFNEADIEIAFPQRDIHVRSLPSGVTRDIADAIQRGGKSATSSSSNGTEST